MNEGVAQLYRLLDPIEEPICDHYYVAIADETGDPRTPGLWVDCSYMECTQCGHVRDITDAERAQFRDEAERARWVARAELRSTLIDVMGGRR